MQLANRLAELKREQDRVRRAIRNIGEAFAANLDRKALLELALETAMDATGAHRGRITRASGPVTASPRQRTAASSRGWASRSASQNKSR